MAISGFYNSTALVERPTITTDDYGAEIKTWSLSTWVPCDKQGRSGVESVVNTQDRISKSERLYCDVFDVLPVDRFVFSTRSFNYAGDATSTSDLTGGDGSMYFCTSSFSTFEKYDYAINVDSTYIKNDVERNNILYINDRLRGRHLQIDLELDNEDRG